MMNNSLYHSSGNYLGFINDSAIFSRDGDYLGWIEEDNTVWDSRGKYRGNLTLVNNNYYILKDKFILNPLPKIPRVEPPKPIMPIAPSNVSPIDIGFEKVDGFEYR